MKVLSKVKITEYLASLTTDEVELDKLVNVCSMEILYHHIIDAKKVLSEMKVGSKIYLPLVRYGSIRSSCSKWGKLWGSKFAVSKDLNKVTVTRLL